MSLRPFSIALVSMATVVAGTSAVHAQYYGGYYDSGAATAGESYARGVSDMMRSAGQRNLLNSMAAINVEQARSANLDNQIKYTNTYFQKRQLNKQYTEAERGPRPTHDQIVQAAKNMAPKRLSPGELDYLQGSVEWPIVLQSETYATVRDEFNKLYHDHVYAGGGINTPEYAELYSLCNTMLDTLRGNVRETNPQQYIYSKKFLESLRMEIGRPAGS